jgi:6-phosphogluconolactonase
MMATAPELRILRNDAELASEAADFFVWCAQQAVAAGEAFRVALAGGTTPRLLYRALATAFSDKIRWSRVEFYFGDERCVPPSDPESNFGMAEKHLFHPLQVAPDQIFRIPGELEPQAAARQYEGLLRQRFKAEPPAWPRFHLILLGLGEDGHTCSLFPGSTALQEQARAVLATQSPQGIRNRVTLTIPVINHADTVMFVVAGAKKSEAVRVVVEDTQAEPSRYPAKSVNPVGGRLLWFLDQDAAADLTRTRQQVVSEEE